MKKGLLIDPETKQVTTALEPEWTDAAVNQQIHPINGELAPWESIAEHGDKIRVGYAENNTTWGTHFPRHGFQLFGHKYYGKSLIIGTESSPVLTVAGIESEIQFFTTKGSDWVRHNTRALWAKVVNWRN